MLAKQISNSAQHAGNRVSEYAEGTITPMAQPSTETAGHVVMIHKKSAFARFLSAVLTETILRYRAYSSWIAGDIAAPFCGLTRVAQGETDTTAMSVVIVAAMRQVFRCIGPSSAPRLSFFGFSTLSVSNALRRNAFGRLFIILSSLRVFVRHTDLYLTYEGV